jgi:hypothetical protein
VLGFSIGEHTLGGFKIPERFGYLAHDTAVAGRQSALRCGLLCFDLLEVQKQGVDLDERLLSEEVAGDDGPARSPSAQIRLLEIARRPPEEAEEALAPVAHDELGVGYRAGTLMSRVARGRPPHTHRAASHTGH